MPLAQPKTLILLMKQTGPHPGKQTILAYHNNEAHHSQKPYETPVSPHAYVGQHPPNPILFYFNQSVVKLIRYQTK